MTEFHAPRPGPTYPNDSRAPVSRRRSGQPTYRNVIAGSFLGGDTHDARYPSDDTSLGDHASDYRYIPIDNSTQQLPDTVAAILKAIPEVFDSGPG